LAAATAEQDGNDANGNETVEADHPIEGGHAGAATG